VRQFPDFWSFFFVFDCLDLYLVHSNLWLVGVGIRRVSWWPNQMYNRGFTNNSVFPKEWRLEF
jgi:hypothetical protein